MEARRPELGYENHSRAAGWKGDEYILPYNHVSVQSVFPFGKEARWDRGIAKKAFAVSSLQ